jgi:hypothetical protein
VVIAFSIRPWSNKVEPSFYCMSFLKSLFGFGDNTRNLADRAKELYPAPNANEAEYQRDALADLHKGISPTGYTLAGYLCKKGEKVIFSFNGVTHYCSAVHSEWAGVSKQKSARILLSRILSFQPGSGTGADDFEFSLETDQRSQ